ncbi:hypothetical protein [Larkinella humicola]|uniref:Uncharacterized protein n=1 Tax=Larkinella humicola TaxID=2607654 RepID=A0A5N1JJY4_9BACT|nr:hypothetical protein [Larkinella humicola]KAA9356411.1 hypothetical protein F0P93_01260 [Larkinella humicola]
MRNTLWFIVLLITSLLCFAAYCISVVDWVRDVQTGVYQQNRMEGVLETGAQILYLYLAVRFVRSHVNML